MELEQMQAIWSQLSSELEQQKIVTKQIILQMTQERYSNKFKTIFTFETFGMVICFTAALYILLNVNRLDTWYLLTCGIFTIAFLLTMPIMVLGALHKIKSVDILTKSYEETLISFSKAKKNLLMLQKLSFYSSFILMISSAAVFSKIWSNKDFFRVERGLWVYGAIALAFVFLIFFVRWGYKSYKGITNSAENIIKALDQ